MKQLHKNQETGLDILRYISCVVVFTGHFLQTFVYRISPELYAPKTFLMYVLRLAPTYAVMIFFVLSGYLITYSTLIKRKFDLKEFLEARFLRIFPPLLFSILLTVTVYLLVNGFHLFGMHSYHLPGDLYSVRTNASLSYKNIIKIIFLLPNSNLLMDGPLWSLSYEFYYYIFFALIVHASCLNISKKTKALLLVCIIILMCLFSNSIVVFSLGYVWLLGVGLCLLYQKGFIDEISWLKIFLFYGVTISISIVYYLYVSRVLQVANLWMPQVKGFPLLFQILVATCLTSVPIVLIRGDFSFSVLLKKCADGSKYTYTLYLIHFPILLLTLSFIGSKLLSYRWYHYVLLFIILFFLVNACSYFFSRFLENKSVIKRVFFSESIALKIVLLVYLSCYGIFGFFALVRGLFG